jgi:long-chain acyl-CoA synthetase
VLGAGVTGEVAIRTVCNFGGYWQNPQATAEAITADGWFRTGDLGYLDTEGYLFIVDRKKDIIIRGGENITCIEWKRRSMPTPMSQKPVCSACRTRNSAKLPVAVYQVEEGTQPVRG